MKKLKKLLKWFGIFSLVCLTFYLGLYVYAKMLPKLPIDKANSFYLYDNDNKLYKGGNSKEWVALDDISPYLVQATLAIEDKNFYSHKGFDFLRIIKALHTNAVNRKRLEGASTISQQYAKNLFLDFDKTWKRKIDEAWLTIRLESHYSKDKILEGYLNTINYGGIFGIENASQYYFNKKARDLTLAEASILAGIPKDPTYYSPISNEKASKKRQKLILSLMKKQNYITNEQMNKAYQKKLNYHGDKNTNQLKTLMYYQDAVIKELKKINSIPSSFLKTGGLKIYTNLDMDTQEEMEKNISQYLDYNEELQIASVVMDPKNGKILALAGGRDYSESQFNRVTDAKRQVGSTMKPFLYYAALENGFTPSSTFKSEKTTFVLSKDEDYSPENYGKNYPNKQISMATALAYSDNIYAVKTHIFLGENTLVETAKRVGISNKLHAIPSLALGTEEINLLSMVEGYGTLASEGYKIKPYLIRKVTDSSGNVLYEHKTNKENVLNKSIVFVLNEMLSNSYAKEFIDYNYPTCINIAPKITKKYAIKTGTTNTDHLIFGYNKDVLMGIWAGYDDNHESDVKDGNSIKSIWVDTVEHYLKNKDGNQWYDIPKNVVGVIVNPVTGEVATDQDKKKKMLYYIKGTEPTSENKELDQLIPAAKIKPKENTE
ncbi:MAG: penicillin-binding protein [Bacilli bacterium]|nr:penicillin-binding protein [Bacilli bacterium]